MTMFMVLLIISRAIAAEPVPVGDPTDRLVCGTILSISYTTGDLLLSPDEGTVLVLYGIDSAALRDLSAGDRVRIRLGADAEVREVARIEL
ncbi:MAG: hypothetical protein QNJ01_18115 [Desulfobacterales bacterium]|nr:hypothetical protein [Desulfobacterales bacterium]